MTNGGGRRGISRRTFLSTANRCPRARPEQSYLPLLAIEDLRGVVICGSG
jgi:hypothetical protein